MSEKNQRNRLALRSTLLRQAFGVRLRSLAEEESALHFINLKSWAPNRIRTVLASSILTLAISGCATAPYQDSESNSPTVQLAKTLVKTDSTLPPLLFHPQEYVEHKYKTHIYEISYPSREGAPNIQAVFGKFCQDNGGDYRDGFCTSDNETIGRFYVQAIPKEHLIVDFVVEEALDPPGIGVWWFARTHGYKRSAEISAEKIAAEQSALAIAAAPFKRKEASSRTRSNVIQKGTRICLVDDRRCDKDTVCYTEDYNPENGMLKATIGQATNWTNVELWYACPNGDEFAPSNRQ